MGKPKTIIMTGGTSEFFPYLRECVDSLIATGVLERADLGIVDQGMTDEQLATLHGTATHIVRPTWTGLGMRVPEVHQQDRHLNLAARSDLPAIFPGYDVYLWFDADAWAQSADFFDVYVNGAMESGLAVAKENGHGYNPSYLERRWWIGNYFLGFGLVDGMRGGVLAAPINIGLVAIHRDAPHWKRYRERHQTTIDRTGKINLDQHSCHATIALDKLPATFVHARHNWLPVLSRPTWDADRKLLCDPSADGEPLTVIHLAGPDKKAPRKLRIVQGGEVSVPLNYSAYRAFKTDGSVTGAEREANQVKALTGA
jgi:hypothetical protein